MAHAMSSLICNEEMIFVTEEPERPGVDSPEPGTIDWNVPLPVIVPDLSFEPKLEGVFAAWWSKQILNEFSPLHLSSYTDGLSFHCFPHPSELDGFCFCCFNLFLMTGSR